MLNDFQVGLWGDRPAFSKFELVADCGSESVLPLVTRIFSTYPGTHEQFFVRSKVGERNHESGILFPVRTFNHATYRPVLMQPVRFFNTKRIEIFTVFAGYAREQCQGMLAMAFFAGVRLLAMTVVLGLSKCH